jgi:14-3-3 protein epsilon
MTSERDLNFWVAQLLDQTDRQDDMIDLVKAAIDAGPVLTVDQRNLLSLAYKNAITAQRNGLRYLANLLDRDEAKASQFRLSQLQGFRRELTEELDRYCHDLVQLVDTKLLPACDGADARVFYVKLKADYWRYISENKSGADKAKSADEAKSCYEEAIAIARDGIKPWIPGHLGLILNYSVYLYEIVGLEREAIELAQKTHEECSDSISNNGPEAFREATKILLLLRENVALWTQSATPE